MIGDEPLMFQRWEELSTYQQEHHASMRFNILPFAMCFIAVSRSDDEVFLDELFLEKEELFNWHLHIYSSLNMQTSNRLRFMEPDEIYEKAIDSRKKHQKISSACFSYDVNDCVDIENQLAISKMVNSKIDLVESARKAQFQIPRSVIFSREQLSEKGIQESFDFPNEGLVIKSDGLGGGFNVCRIETFDDCREFIERYPAGTMFVLQSEIDPCHHGEFIADYLVKPESVELLNLRLKLTTEDKWFGNVYSPKFAAWQDLPDLERCINDVRARGYCSEDGYICGVDFFSPNNDPNTQLITDINARWTGGLPVALLIKKLGLEHRTVYSHLDEILEGDLPRYRKLIEAHLLSEQRVDESPSKQFELFPVSFSPQIENGKFYVWLIVTGNYTAFVETKQQYLSQDSLPFAETVAMLIEQNAHWL